MTISKPGDDIEASEAAYEFAMLIKKESNRRKIEDLDENYEVRPCAQVRGFTLKLPVLGWKLWYPTAVAAAKFARRVANCYRADCFVYDSTGRIDPQFAQN